jgi:hypothetical protein
MHIAVSLLVIVFIVDRHGIGALEQKRHTPVTTHRHGPLASAVPAELVEI